MPQLTRGSHLSLLLGGWGQGARRRERRGGERRGWGLFTHLSVVRGVQQPPDGPPETSLGQEDSQGRNVDQNSNWAFSPPDMLPQLPSPLATVETACLLVPWFHVAFSVRLGRSLGCHERLCGVPSAILWVGTQEETRVRGLRNSFQASVSPSALPSQGFQESQLLF